MPTSFANRVASYLKRVPSKAERAGPSRIMPMVPTPRQKVFLGVQAEEALYGGAAGGGKSEGLLMWLAEGIDIPNYSGIIFRRTYQQLTKSNDSLVAKSMRLYPALGGKFNHTKLQWRFPSGAMIEMGATEHAHSVFNFQGPAWHRAAFDELTHFLESQYEFITNTRIRRVVGCPISLGVRSATNPGGLGHLWVKNKFVTAEAMDALKALAFEQPTPSDMVFSTPEGRVFVPARLADNPYLDVHDYRKRMEQMSDPVMRERMMNGDWSVQENSLIRGEWFRYWTQRGDYIELRDAENQVFGHYDQRGQFRFATCDPAGTAADKAAEAKGKHSWTVIQVWERPQPPLSHCLILRHNIRIQVNFPGLCQALQEMHAEWKPSRILIENEKLGTAATEQLAGKLPIETVATGGQDKVTRAAPFLNALEAGRVFLPLYDNAWRSVLEAEWLSWTGHPDSPADQIDPASYAVREFGGDATPWGGVVQQDWGPVDTGFKGVGWSRFGN